MARNESGNPCHFSTDRKHRYSLLHQFTATKTPKLVNFVALNPSTADENQLDPTLRRMRGFAEAWGYHSFVVTNIFAWRSTDYRQLFVVDDPVGPENDRWIRHFARKADLVILCWGNHGQLKDRGAAVAKLLRKHSLHVLRMNKSGHPQHPLYLPKNLQPTPWVDDACAG